MTKSNSTAAAKINQSQPAHGPNLGGPVGDGGGVAAANRSTSLDNHAAKSPGESMVYAVSLNDNVAGDAGRWIAGNSPTAICVIDLDNLCNHKSIRGSFPTLRLDFLKLAAALRQRGVKVGSVCQNHEFSMFGKKVWSELGLKTVAAHQNCHGAVKLEAVTYALEHPEYVILVGGDGDYVPVIAAIRACGIKIELWSIRYKTARALIYLADRVIWIDHLFNEPPPCPAGTISITSSPTQHADDGPDARLAA